jgi:hypothetical protein
MSADLVSLLFIIRVSFSVLSTITIHSRYNLLFIRNLDELHSAEHVSQIHTFLSCHCVVFISLHNSSHRLYEQSAISGDTPNVTEEGQVLFWF